MKRTIVFHHTNQLGLGGTEKTIKIFCKYLNSEKYDVHVLCRKNTIKLRKLCLDRLRAGLGLALARERLERYKLNLCRLSEFRELLGWERIHLYSDADLPSIIRKHSPDILHLHHSGKEEGPLKDQRCWPYINKFVSTNIFGLRPDERYRQKLDRILFISEWLKKNSQWDTDDPRCGILYNPIEKPSSKEDLRRKLGISKKTIVIGRIGRNANDIYDPISLKAYKIIESDDVLFLAVAPPSKMVEEAKTLGVKRIKFLPTNSDDNWISSFYNTLDIMAHARLDGETFGCVIAEAMYHGIPVVSHFTDQRNAQAELISNCGLIVAQNDVGAYAAALKMLIKNYDTRKKYSAMARQRAIKKFDAIKITKSLEKIYDEILK